MTAQRRNHTVSTVALVDWCHVIEDFLDNLGLDLESLCNELSGGWMFGYLDALRRAGCRPILICMSTRLRKWERRVHRPTGTPLLLLPSPDVYRAIRTVVPNPYAITVEEAAGVAQGPRRHWLSALRSLAPYLSTPMATLARVLREERCDAVICQEYENPRFDLVVGLGRLLGIPVFATFQGGDWQLSPLERFVRPTAIRLCAGLIVAPRAERDRIRNEYHRVDPPIAAIPNPIDLDLYRKITRPEARRSLGIPETATVVAWHGRLDWHRKGLDVLLDAWERALGTRPGRDLRLRILGSGRDSARLQERIQRGPSHGIEWSREYSNDRNAIVRHLVSADLYAFPSRHEGFPVAPLEAMASGVAVLGSDTPGVRDLFSGLPDSEHLLVPPEDPAALAQAIGERIDDLEHAHRLGQQARSHVETRFETQAVGHQLREFLRSPRPMGTSSNSHRASTFESA